MNIRNLHLVLHIILMYEVLYNKTSVLACKSDKSVANERDEFQSPVRKRSKRNLQLFLTDAEITDTLPLKDWAAWRVEDGGGDKEHYCQQAERDAGYLDHFLVVRKLLLYIHTYIQITS